MCVAIDIHVGYFLYYCPVLCVTSVSVSRLIPLTQSTDKRVEEHIRSLWTSLMAQRPGKELKV